MTMKFFKKIKILKIFYQKCMLVRHILKFGFLIFRIIWHLMKTIRSRTVISRELLTLALTPPFVAFFWHDFWTKQKLSPYNQIDFSKQVFVNTTKYSNIFMFTIVKRQIFIGNSKTPLCGYGAECGDGCGCGLRAGKILPAPVSDKMFVEISIFTK